MKLDEQDHRDPLGAGRQAGRRLHQDRRLQGVPPLRLQGHPRALHVDPGNASENEAALAVSRYQLYVGWQLNTG